MNLIKLLSSQGYDYIEGISREHRPLQLWRDRMFDRPECLSEHVDHTFKSPIALEEIVNPALNIDFSQKQDYNFNFGLTALEGLLKSLNLGVANFSASLGSGKDFTISFSDTISKEYRIGNIDAYLYEADLLHPNPPLVKDLNKNNIMIVSGVLFAKKFQVELTTSTEISAEAKAELAKSVSGNIKFEYKNEKSLKMIASNDTYFPVAVKADQLCYDHSEFKKTKLLTDTRNIF